MSATDWRPGASQQTLVERARLLAAIRAFFAARGVMEVDTPVLAQGAASEPGLQSFVLQQAPERRLITSPEFAMKRLLAAGSGPIYRLGPAFRADEAGRWHNPEFCMLEWYRPGLDYVELIQEVGELFTALVPDAPPVIKRSVADVFKQTCGLNPHDAPVSTLREAAERRGWAPDQMSGQAPDDHNAGTRDFWLDLILGIGVAEILTDGGACFIYDYPACMAMLTRTRAGDPPVAERFEMYWQGVELANGGNELVDAERVKARFAEDIALRRNAGSDTAVGDARLLAAQVHGLPPCAGVALGVDRLLALKLGFDEIAPVLPFAWDRA